MARLTLQVLAIICLVASLAIAQELRGRRLGENVGAQQTQAGIIMSLRQESHSVEAEALDEHARALTWKNAGQQYPSSRGTSIGFDLTKNERPRNVRDPGSLQKLASSKTIVSAQNTRGRKPADQSAIAAAAKAVREKKGGRKKTGIKGKFKKLGARLKGAGQNLKKALRRKKAARKKRGGRRKRPGGTRPKSTTMDTAPGTTDEGDNRIEPQNPLKPGLAPTDEGDDREEPQNPLKPVPKPSDPLVIPAKPLTPQPQAPKQAVSAATPAPASTSAPVSTPAPVMLSTGIAEAPVASPVEWSPSSPISPISSPAWSPSLERE